jgi:hypothetical protein
MGKILRRADGGSESAGLRSQTSAKATGGGSSSPSSFGVAETISLASAFAVGTGESSSASGNAQESVAGLTGIEVSDNVAEKKEGVVKVLH